MAIGLSISTVIASILISSWNDQFTRAKARLPAHMALSIIDSMMQRCLSILIDESDNPDEELEDCILEAISNEDFNSGSLELVDALKSRYRIKIRRDVLGIAEESFHKAILRIRDLTLTIGHFLPIEKTRPVEEEVRVLEFALASLKPPNKKGPIPNYVATNVARYYQQWQSLRQHFAAWS